MEFPQYRKQFNEKSFYKIISPTSFEEIQLIGKSTYKHTIVAEKYFEKVRIQEMLAAENKLYLKSTEEEYNTANREK